MSDAPFPDSLAQLRRRWDADRSSRLFLQLAEEYRHRGNLREALGVLEEGLKGHPGYLSALVAKGRCHLELGQPLEARAALERVVRQDPTQEIASKLLVRALVELGAASDARERLRLYCLLHERDPEVVELERRIAAAEAPADETPTISETIADGVPSAANREVAETSSRGSETMTEDLFDLAPGPPTLPTFSPNDDLFGLYAEDLLASAAPPLVPSSVESLFPELEGRSDRGSWLAALAKEGLFDFEGAAAPSPSESKIEPQVEPQLVPQIEPIVAAPWVAETETAFDADETLDVLHNSPSPPAPSGTSVATVTLAELYSRQGHSAEAERIYREVLTREPENVGALRGLAALAPSPALEVEVAAEAPLAPLTPLAPAAVAAAVIPEGNPVERKIARLTAYLERLRRGRSRLVS